MRDVQEQRDHADGQQRGYHFCCARDDCEAFVPGAHVVSLSRRLCQARTMAAAPAASQPSPVKPAKAYQDCGRRVETHVSMPPLSKRTIGQLTTTNVQAKPISRISTLRLERCSVSSAMLSSARARARSTSVADGCGVGRRRRPRASNWKLSSSAAHTEQVRT